VQNLIRDAELALRASSSPLERHAIEQSLFLLRRLDRRLGDLSRPVSPYGVLVVGELPNAAERPDALTEALAALDDQR
jgi:cobalamin biosynthesis Mg chelatase CobN